MSSNVLIKIRVESGRQAVYDCQPQHVSNIDDVKRYGNQIATRYSERWFLDDHLLDRNSDQRKALEEMKIDFDEIPGQHWEIEVQVESGGVKEWQAMHPGRRLTPYQFDNELEAQETAEMNYPDHQSQVRVVLRDASKPASRPAMKL